MLETDVDTPANNVYCDNACDFTGKPWAGLTAAEIADFAWCHTN